MQSRIRTWLRQAAVIFLVICIGTVFDWFAHQTDIRFSVPEYYFRNKIIFGTIDAFIALQIFRIFVRDDRWLAFWTMLALAVALQTRYFLEGYDRFFVFLFFGIHFIVFVIPALMLFPKFRMSRRDRSISAPS